jgi:hypothetical protein
VFSAISGALDSAIVISLSPFRIVVRGKTLAASMLRTSVGKDVPDMLVGLVQVRRVTSVLGRSSTVFLVDR